MIKDKLIRIKRSRLKSEEIFLIDIFNGMTIKEQTLYPNNICWEKDGNVLFLYKPKTNHILVNYSDIWEKLDKQYFSYKDKQLFLNKMFSYYLKMEVNCGSYGQRYLKNLDNKIGITESHLFY